MSSLCIYKKAPALQLAGISSCSHVYPPSDSLTILTWLSQEKVSFDINTLLTNDTMKLKVKPPEKHRSANHELDL